MYSNWFQTIDIHAFHPAVVAGLLALSANPVGRRIYTNDHWNEPKVCLDSIDIYTVMYLMGSNLRKLSARPWTVTEVGSFATF